MAQQQTQQAAADDSQGIHDGTDGEIHANTLSQSDIGDNQRVPETSTTLPLAWSLGVYFVLQLLLNLRLRGIAQDLPDRRDRLLRVAFSNGVVNSLFFILLSTWLILSGSVPRPVLPQPLWAWLLGSLPAGLLLWALHIRMLGIGRRLFGRSNFVQPAEFLLRNPADLAQLNRAALQVSLLEPMGRELFFRACFLALMVTVYGPLPAVLATAIVELLLRLNPSWALSVLIGSLLLSAISISGGGPLTTLCVALVAGFLQAYVTAYQSLRSTERTGQAD